VSRLIGQLSAGDYPEDSGEDAADSLRVLGVSELRTIHEEPEEDDDDDEADSHPEDTDSAEHEDVPPAPASKKRAPVSPSCLRPWQTTDIICVAALGRRAKEIRGRKTKGLQ
jgi:hypothetical protein